MSQRTKKKEANPERTSVAGYEPFEFDLPSALNAELVQRLNSMDSAPLTSEVAGKVPEVQGVYQLFHGNELVYIGKTDAEAGLRTRLTRHSKKILHRPSFEGAVYFKAVRVMVFTAMDLETQLIKHYRKGNKKASPWNGSGFGSNDPGQKRESTDKKPEGFDAQYPINIDLPDLYLSAGTTTAAEAVAALKAKLPYTFRYETERNAKGKALPNRPHPELISTHVTVADQPQRIRNLLQMIRAALGDEWQATYFVSHVILYKEKTLYTHGQPI